MEIFGIGPPTLIRHFLGDTATATVVPLFVVSGGRTVIAAALLPLLIVDVVIVDDDEEG